MFTGYKEVCQNRVVHSAVKVNKGKVIQMLLSGKAAVNKVGGGVCFAPVGKHSSLSKRSIGHAVHHIAVFVAYFFYAAVKVGMEYVQGVAVVRFHIIILHNIQNP